jgi:DNA-binding NtrC family response regulator
LVADDEDTLRVSLAEVLQEEGFDVIACRDGTEALRALRNNTIDALITDLRMPGITGMELIDHARTLAPDATIVVITAYGEVDTAVEAIRKGARDYICKPLIFDEVILKLKRLLAYDELARRNRVLSEQIRKKYDDSRIVGESRRITAIRETVERVSRTMNNVLICGESGTGKEVIARAIHYGGVTKDKPFIAVNCGGLAGDLLESDLFGYRRGAFTGADADHMGSLEAANGGTLFLDEVGDLSYDGQTAILGALERQAVTRVGDSRPRPVQIRVVAATNLDLEQASSAGEFREDLYILLNVVQITVPPLRQRREDIELLLQHFVRQYKAELNSDCPGFAPEAVAAMRSHSWPGNVRELQNVVERGLILAGGKPVGLDGLPFVVGERSVPRSLSTELRRATREFEKQHISRVLAGVDYNKTAAAAALGIGLSSLYRKMDEFGVPKALSEPGTTCKGGL